MAAGLHLAHNILDTLEFTTFTAYQITSQTIYNQFIDYDCKLFRCAVLFDKELVMWFMYFIIVNIIIGNFAERLIKL